MVKHNFVGRSVEVQNQIIAAAAVNGKVIFNLRRCRGERAVKNASHIGKFRIRVDGCVERAVGDKKIVERTRLLTPRDQNVVASTAIKVVDTGIRATTTNQNVISSTGTDGVAAIAAAKHIAL